jgi:hypothetical protein
MVQYRESAPGLPKNNLRNENLQYYIQSTGMRAFCRKLRKQRKWENQSEDKLRTKIQKSAKKYQNDLVGVK